MRDARTSRRRDGARRFRRTRDRASLARMSPEKKISKKSPNPIDRHVGARVRMRRMMVSMSQEKLGDKLGITFQQIQKYEKGTNRIGASRLQHIASVLQVPVAFFFEDAPGAVPPRNAGRSAVSARLRRRWIGRDRRCGGAPWRP